MFTIGIDIGSSASKCVVLADGKEIKGAALNAAGLGSADISDTIYIALKKAGIVIDNIAVSAVTGYGRNGWRSEDTSVIRVSELTCHAYGAVHIFPETRTVIDIGGQDSKSISIDGKGRMNGFLMNDKCAAGTGRFLEVMTRILGVSFGEFDKLALSAESPVEISNTCTVFAESEVISRLAAGTPRADIASGVCSSIASRVGSLAKRGQVNPAICISGGVSNISSIRKAIGRVLESEILYSPLAQYFGALGAAIYAHEKINVSKKQEGQNG